MQRLRVPLVHSCPEAPPHDPGRFGIPSAPTPDPRHLPAPRAISGEGCQPIRDLDHMPGMRAEAQPHEVRSGQPKPTWRKSKPSATSKPAAMSIDEGRGISKQQLQNQGVRAASGDHISGTDAPTARASGGALGRGHHGESQHGRMADLLGAMSTFSLSSLHRRRRMSARDLN